jgi:hypothetical protein
MPRDIPTLCSRSLATHSCSEVSAITQRRIGWQHSRQSSYRYRASFIRGPAFASPSNTRGGSPVRESRPPGSVRGVRSNAHPYRDTVSDLQLALLPNSGHRELVRQTSSPVLIRQEIFMTHQDSRPRIGVSSALAARTGSKYSLRNAILPSAARRKTT